MMILRGEVTLFAYYDLGGLWKISKKITSSIGGPTILQELKDDVLDDTARPVVMQWFSEDHWRPLNTSLFKNTALTTGHDLSDH